MAKRKVLIIGGVAGGASCAARLRRLDEECSITILERGPHVSFANCGLPYHIGGVIAGESDLVLAGPELFRRRFDIDVRLHHEAVRIDRDAGRVLVRHTLTGGESFFDYDALVLAPGAAPIRPPLPGIDLPGIFSLRTIPDAKRIKEWIESRGAKTAVVVGGGYIGVEMAENLVHMGLETGILEAGSQILPTFDPEMSRLVQDRLEERGCGLALGDSVEAFAACEGGGLEVFTRGGARHRADVVVLALGVRPETDLAREAGLKIGDSGGIEVDGRMRTSDPAIWAVGDAVESTHVVDGEPLVLALAGPANRQGRIAADNIAGRERLFRGVQGTSIVGVFGLAAASTGLTETALRKAGDADHRCVHIHPMDHVGYYPGARQMHLKIVFRPGDGTLLGAQAVGEGDVARRIDVISAFLQMGGTVEDLAEAELCYAPPYGAAKDAANFAGMVAWNAMDGDMPVMDWRCIPAGTFLLDVRDEDEFEQGHVPGAVNIPLPELRRDFSAVPGNRPVGVYCKVGQRGYYAARFLRHQGIDARNLSGGILTWNAIQSGFHEGSGINY